MLQDMNSQRAIKYTERKVLGKGASGEVSLGFRVPDFHRVAIKNKIIWVIPSRKGHQQKPFSFFNTVFSRHHYHIFKSELEGICIFSCWPSKLKVNAYRIKIF